jgi:hypothetical protein
MTTSNNLPTTENDLRNNSDLAAAQEEAVIAGVQGFASKTKLDYFPKQNEYKVICSTKVS